MLQAGHVYVKHRGLENGLDAQGPKKTHGPGEAVWTSKTHRSEKEKVWIRGAFWWISAVQVPSVFVFLVPYRGGSTKATSEPFSRIGVLIRFVWV